MHGRFKKLTQTFTLSALLFTGPAVGLAENTGKAKDSSEARAQDEDFKPQTNRNILVRIFTAPFVPIVRKNVHNEGPLGMLTRIETALADLKRAPYDKEQISEAARNAKCLLKKKTFENLLDTAAPHIKDGQLTADELMQISLALGRESQTALDAGDPKTKALLEKSAGLLKSCGIEDADGAQAAALSRLAIDIVNEIAPPAPPPPQEKRGAIISSKPR